jgi:hypothetical protein
MKRIIASLAILVTSTTLAFAQAAPKKADPAPAPAAPQTQAAKPATPPAAPVQSARGGGRGLASSPVEAKQAFDTKVAVKSTECTSRGNMWKFVPAHGVGDAAPTGGFYTSYAGPKCVVDAKMVPRH